MNTFDIDYQKMTIEKIFDNLYVVPEYQREYVWDGDVEVDALLSDLISAYENNPDKTYFMGTTVVYSNNSNKYELIDGQQRITTFFLIICAIIHVFKENKCDASAFEQKLHSTKYIGKGKSKSTYALELQYTDSTDILEKIYNNDDSLSSKEMEDGSCKKLCFAYEYIKKELDRKYQIFDDFAGFADYIWQKVQIIQIETKDISEALKIFETINQRGKGLDSLDLLKNMIFMQVNRNQFKTLNDEWKNMMEKLRTVESKPLRFLRYYITSNFDITDPQTGVIKGILPEDDIYSWLSNNDYQCNYKDDPLGFMDSMSKAADKYVQYIKPKALTPGNNYLININRFAGKSYRSHMVLLLAAKNMEDDTLKYFKQLLESIVYYATINSIKGNETEKLFANWAVDIRKIRTIKDLKNFTENVISIQIDKWILEKQYKTKFLELNLNSIQKYRIKFILGRIEKYIDEYRANGKNFADVEGNCASNIEVEHIMPQECQDKDKYSMTNEEEFLKYLMSIGNLTLLEKTYNSSCKNKSYEEKKQFYQSSTLYLTNSIHELSGPGANNAAKKMDKKLKSWDAWNKKSIEERAEILYSLAEEIWNINAIEESWKETQ